MFSEAAAERFTIGLMDGPFRVGQTFSIPVEFHDEYGNLTKPNKDIKPELSARYSLRLTLCLYYSFDSFDSFTLGFETLCIATMTVVIMFELFAVGWKCGTTVFMSKVQH